MAQGQSIDRDKELGPSSSRVYAARRRGLLLAFAATGAISFWLPDVAIHAGAGPNLDARHAWAITVLAPAIFLFAYLVARRFALKYHFKRVGPTMLLGVWLTGGLFMTVGAILSRSEFIGGAGIWRIVMICMSVIPIVTFVLAALDGSALALLAITVGSLLILGFRASIALWSSADRASGAAVKTVSEGNESRAA
ncbi:MAG TPA: hypothetical protein VMG82_21520 [Candidatus Sulfotelmatobacter sp.]|nr:hypothetical protein [Candidatus Sulfotelmatobacter sp.]